jgi:hypothetical protein
LTPKLNNFLTRTRRGPGQHSYLQATSSSVANANLSSSNCCWLFDHPVGQEAKS